VRIHRLVRTWNVRCGKSCATYLGVHQVGGGDSVTGMGSSDSTGNGNKSNESTSNPSGSSSSCVGVLIPVFSNELSALDARELGYTRHLVTADRIERVDHLLLCGEEHNDEAQQIHYENTFLDTQDSTSSSTTTARVWVYVPDEPQPATSCYPILQSYVDICMRGCLSISYRFLQEFLASTYGWHSKELLRLNLRGMLQEGRRNYDDDDTQDNEKSSTSSTTTGNWSNDRHEPMYVRADKDYSLEYALHLDECLENACLPLEQLRA